MTPPAPSPDPSADPSADHLVERTPPTLVLADDASDLPVLALPVSSSTDGPEPGEGTAAVLAAHGLDLAAVAADARFTGAAGSVLAFPVAPAGQDGLRRLVLVGTGDGSVRALRRAGAALARSLAGQERVAVGVSAGQDAEHVAALAEGLLLGAYQTPRTGTSTPPGPVGTLVLQGTGGGADLGRAVQRAVSTCRATWLARDLASTPSSVKNPGWMARTAVDLARDVPGLEVEVLEAGALAERGFGGLLAVGGASDTPPALVRVTWTPPDAGRGGSSSSHVVLVGKGITYDTGGLSIKPREAMVPMKTDMSGAGVVLATVLAAARDGVPHRVTALLALAENAVGGGSYRPGDVVTVYGGTTVEIANTDAEGRVVLADALAYADEVLDPDVLVDVATLTGAASMGLGRRHAALYSDDDDLAGALASAGEACGELAWRMPLVADYMAEVESDVADLRHVTADRTRFAGGGSIAAALFLRELVGQRRWAHLDVAGPSRADRDEHEVNKGATGYGARLLLGWLRALDR